MTQTLLEVCHSSSIPSERPASNQTPIVSRPYGKSTLDEYPIEEIVVFRVKPQFNPLNARLPGQGEQGESCGKPAPHRCSDCGKPFWAYSSCRQRECPDCYQKWASKEAFKASKRIWLKRLELTRQGIRCRVLHTTVSLPYQGETLPELRAAAKQIARRKGISGELSIFHPFRQKDDQWVIDGHVHFHIVGIALGDVKPAAQGEGFVWKVIKDARYNDYKGIRKLRHLKSLIQYQLSHSGIVDAHHGVSWSGILSYNKFKQQTLDQDDSPLVGRKCPFCGSVNTEPVEFFTLDGQYYAYDVGVKPGLLGQPPPRRRVRVVFQLDT